MIYRAPGVGKTSILNSLIIPILEDQFEIPPVVRVGLGRAAIISDQMMTAIHNIYVFSVLQRLAPNVDPTLLMKYTFCQFLNDYFPPKVDRLGREIPPIIVFDQLEELFEFYPERWLAQQEDFFTQIADALNGDPDLGIVLVIREDHLAHLDHFASILTEKLKIRFRLEPLHKDAALAANTASSCLSETME